MHVNIKKKKKKKKKKKAEKTDTSASGSRKKNLQLKQWLLYMLPMKTPAATLVREKIYTRA